MLVLRDDTLACLELLVEIRLALSSTITVEEREDVVVPLFVVPVSAVVDEEPPPPSSLLHEMTVRVKMDMRIMYRAILIFFLHQ